MYILIKNLFYVNICTKKDFRTIYQERLLFYYFENHKGTNGIELSKGQNWQYLQNYPNLAVI